MKKVLILAYDFPPYVSVGGLRPYSWYKYFKEFGLYPIVVTRQWGNKYGNHLDYIAPGESDNSIIEETEFGTIIRTPFKPNLANRIMLKFGSKKFKLLRKIITAYFEFAQWFFIVGTKSNLYKESEKYLENQKVDLIIATGDPFILFKYASDLSQKFKIPWLADYRDPWSQNKSNSRNAFLQIWNRRVEKKYLKNVSRIVTVSPFFASQISELIKNKKYSVVTNGFDPEAIAKIEEIKQGNDKLRIGFVGTINKWHPVYNFIETLSAFVLQTNEPRIEVNFYGTNMAEEISSFVSNKFPHLINIVFTYQRIPNDELLQKLAHNNLMLLFNYYSIIGTKIYDYLAVKRVILLCYKNDNQAIKLKEKHYILNDIDGYSQHFQEDVILDTNSGYIVRDSYHLLNLLTQLYAEFLKNGEIPCVTENFDKYSRKVQCEKLAFVVNEVLNNFDNKKISAPDNITVCDSQISTCSRCVMDNSDADIKINNDGHCNHCSNFFERISHRVYQGEKSETDLLQIIDKIKLAGKKSKYDCVIGVSGGVDSSYLAYKAKKRGLRALLVHLDNGWNSEISVKNIKNLADILGFDYESFVLDWEEFKDLQLSFLRASVPEMETPTDIAILGALHKVAAKYGVKYILSGGNFATEGILPKTWHYDAKDAKYLYSIHKKFGRKKLKSFPMFGFKQEAYYKFIKGIKIVYLLNYCPYNKEESMKILQNELGWRYYGGKHYESKYTGFVQSYIMPVKFNMDYRRATFSTQICTGEVTREWALAELEKPPYNPDTVQAEKEYVCKKLGISISEFEQIMNEPPKLYRDYPNNEKMLQSLYRLYRKLTKTQSYKGD